MIKVLRLIWDAILFLFTELGKLFFNPRGWMNMIAAAMIIFVLQDDMYKFKIALVLFGISWIWMYYEDVWKKNQELKKKEEERLKKKLLKKQMWDEAESKALYKEEDGELV